MSERCIFWIVEVWIICLPLEVVVIHKKDYWEENFSSRRKCNGCWSGTTSSCLHAVWWAELCPSKFRCCSANRQYLRMGRILRYGFYRDSQVQMRSLQWDLISHGQCPYEEVEFLDADSHTNMPGKHEDGHLQANKAWNSCLPHSPEEGTTLISRPLSLHNCETTHFCCLCLSVCGTLLWKLYQTDTNLGH